jgi:lipid-binding SYLF domain-containing protein
VSHDPCCFLNSSRNLKSGGGLVFLRRVTPLPRRDTVYFCSGAYTTDFVLLVMNRRGADSILSSEVKLGGDMAAAAGPVGRSAAASTDASMRAEILSYSRSRGLFAGISLEGSTLRADNDGNEKIYGKGITAKDIVINSAIRPPASAKLLLGTLNKKSPKNKSE